MQTISAIQVQTTQTLLFDPPGQALNPENPWRVKVTNLGPNAIYIGQAGVTTATGYPVPASGKDEFMVYDDAPLYAIAATANQVSPADTRTSISKD